MRGDLRGHGSILPWKVRNGVAVSEMSGRIRAENAVEFSSVFVEPRVFVELFVRIKATRVPDLLCLGKVK